MGEHDVSPSWPAAESASVSDELDLDKWIDGTCGLTRTAKVFQRGDLITTIDSLRTELEVAKKVEKDLPKGERGLNDRGSVQIQEQIDALSVEVLGSALTFHVQDRTQERRQKIAQRLKKDLDIKDDDVSFEDGETISLHQVADAIIKVEIGGKVKDLPDGFPPNKLREIRDRLGDAALGDLWTTFFKVTSEAPQVSAPLSRRSSSGHGGIT